MLSIHHIIGDRQSLQTLNEEWVAAYRKPDSVADLSAFHQEKQEIDPPKILNAVSNLNADSSENLNTDRYLETLSGFVLF